MKSAMLGILFLLPVLALLLAVPVLIGVYVYRDASRRGMNAALWTLASAVVPMFAGFILYLLIRGGHPDLRCPRCGSFVGEAYTVCPSCGARLKCVCPACGRPVEADWAVCPYCAAALPAEQPEVTPPERPRDRALWKILAAAVAVPGLLAVAAVLMFSLSGPGGGGASSMTSMTIQEYKDASGLEGEIDSLIAGAEQFDKAYAFRHVEEDPARPEYSFVQYVVYVPAMEEGAGLSFGRGGGLFRDVLTVEVQPGPGGGNRLILLGSSGRGVPELRVEYGGNRLDCQVTDVDVDLCVG